MHSYQNLHFHAGLNMKFLSTLQTNACVFYLTLKANFQIICFNLQTLILYLHRLYRPCCTDRVLVSKKRMHSYQNLHFHAGLNMKFLSTLQTNACVFYLTLKANFQIICFNLQTLILYLHRLYRPCCTDRVLVSKKRMHSYQNLHFHAGLHNISKNHEYR